MKVEISSNVLAGFRRRALRAYPKEHVELAVGKVKRNCVTILSFQSIAYTATPNSVTIWEDDVDEIHEDAKGNGLRVLGRIHSHPGKNVDCAPSEQDWLDFIGPTDAFIGILTIKPNAQRRSCKVRFYKAHSLLPAKII